MTLSPEWLFKCQGLYLTLPKLTFRTLRDARIINLTCKLSAGKIKDKGVSGRCSSDNDIFGWRNWHVFHQRRVGNNDHDHVSWERNELNVLKLDAAFTCVLAESSGHQDTQTRMSRFRVSGCVCCRRSYLSNAARQTTGWPFLPDPSREL